MASRAATSMLVFDSSLMPFSTPLTAEVRNMAAVTMMMTTCAVGLISMPNTAFRPLLICSAPTPSEAATPKAVATIARPLNRPDMARIGRQGSEPVTVLINELPPRRYWKKAIASATTLYTAQGCTPQWKNT